MKKLFQIFPILLLLLMVVLSGTFVSFPAAPWTPLTLVTSASCTSTPPGHFSVCDLNLTADVQFPAATTVGDFGSNLTAIVIDYTRSLPATTTTSEETSVGPSSQADNNNKKSTSFHVIAWEGVTFGLASLLTLLQVLRKSNNLRKYCNLLNWSRRPSENNKTIPLPYSTYNLPESRWVNPGRQHNMNFRLASFLTVVFLLGSVVRPSAGVATRTTAFTAKAKAINQIYKHHLHDVKINGMDNVLFWSLI